MPDAARGLDRSAARILSQAGPARRKDAGDDGGGGTACDGGGADRGANGCIDFASSRVLIRRQRSGLTGELAQPKTAAGTRWIDLPAEMITELKRHRLRTRGEFCFVFDERNWRSRVWAPSLRRAGLRAVRIHDARHSHASWLLAAGADVVAVSRRLGHSDPAVTLRVYSHAVQRRGAAGLGETLAAFMRAECGGGATP